MAFRAYLANRFEYQHESEMFKMLVERLDEGFGSRDGKHILIGNVMCDGNELDAILLKPKGLAIIEMKNYGGRIEFSENGPWMAGGREVLGGNQVNPFRQVRGYRITISTWLEKLGRQAEIDPRPQEAWWQISATILFGRSIEFDDRTLMPGLRRWLQVTDIDQVADRLIEVESDLLKLTDPEFDIILDRLGIKSNMAYCGDNATVSRADPPPPPIAPKRFELVYVKDFNLRGHELRMRNLGGAAAQGAQKVRDWLDQVRQGLNPFAEDLKRRDNRLDGASVYSLNPRCELVMISAGAFNIPAFLGEPDEVDGWLAAHRDLKIVIDEITGKIAITRVSAKSNSEQLQAPTLTTENTALLLRISGIDYEELIPQSLVRQHLLELDETSTDREIGAVLELVFNEDVRAFLFDIINLVRAGDLSGAEARIRLRSGQALPAEEAGQFANVAAAAPENSDQILVINELSKAELDRLLDPENFEEWMLFLHPDQEALVKADFDKPVVLKGVSGSGKTCILVHRARHLARKYPGERIGILTLSRPLAGLLKHLVSKLCSEEEQRNIEILPFYDVLKRCLEKLGPAQYFSQLESLLEGPSHMRSVFRLVANRWPSGMVWDLDPVNKAHVEEEWDEFFMQGNRDVQDWINEPRRYLEDASVDAARYLEEEFTLIRSAFAIPNRHDGYLSFERSGRTIPFKRELRQVVLRVLLFWEEWLLAGGMIDALGLTQALMPLRTEMQSLPADSRFRCLLIDEYQDFSSLDLQVLRRLVPASEPNSLFAAGDPVQKILVKRFRYMDALLDEGSAIHKKIWKNYRNSRQILRAASRLANHYGNLAGSQGEEIEVLDPELAQRETSAPIALSTTNQIEKAWEIAMEFVESDRAEPWTVCIATAAPQVASVDTIIEERPEKLTAIRLGAEIVRRPEEVVVGTISELKGFEFRLVVIVGCNGKSLPYPRIPKEEIWREALRLYVAMTRARDQVFLVFEDEPSHFLTVMGDALIHRHEPFTRPYKKQVASLSAEKPGIRSPSRTNLVDDRINCESWFSQSDLEVLHKFFARYVYRDGLSFREWLTPASLQTVDERRLYRLRNCSRNVIVSLIESLKSRGITGEGQGSG